MIRASKFSRSRIFIIGIALPFIKQDSNLTSTEIGAVAVAVIATQAIIFSSFMLSFISFTYLYFIHRN